MKRTVRSVDVDGVKVSPLFLQAAAAENLAIGYDPSVPYDREYPWAFDAEGPIAPLHEVVWDFYRGALRPRRPGDVVHHKDGDKTNATIQNLGVGTPSAHGLAHASRRQKFTPRQRWNLAGWFRPRGEAKVRDLGFSEDMKYRGEVYTREAQREQERARVRKALEESRAWVAAEAKKKNRPPPTPPPVLPSRAEQRLSAETTLAAFLPALRAGMDHLDSGAKIPPPSSRPKRKDRLMGIQRIRRGCTPAEAALVRLLVMFAFDVEAAADDIQISPHVIRDIMQESSVCLAIENWRGYRRLPPPSSPAKLRPYGYRRPTPSASARPEKA